MMSNPFQGISAAVMTPFLSGGGIDFDALLRMQERLMKAGFSSVTWPGTMGNWTELSQEERAEGTRLLAKEGPLIVGTGALNTSDAVHYATLAQKHDAAGLMIIPRIGYLQTVEEAQEAHFAEVLEAGGPDLPAVAYNNPPSYVYSMGRGPFMRLHERFPQLGGFKESGGPEAMTRAARQITSVDDCFLVIGIDNAMNHGALYCNAVGAITGIGNVLPEQVMYLWNLLQEAREGDSLCSRLATELESRLMQLSNYDADPRLVLYYKMMLGEVGIEGYETHRPVSAGLSDSEAREAKAQLKLFLDWWERWDDKNAIL